MHVLWRPRQLGIGRAKDGYSKRGVIINVRRGRNYINRLSNPSFATPAAGPSRAPAAVLGAFTVADRGGGLRPPPNSSPVPNLDNGLAVSARFNADVVDLLVTVGVHGRLKDRKVGDSAPERAAGM